MANSLFRFVYFTGITIYGYMAVMDLNFFPAALGGNGDYNLCTIGFPYQRHNERTQMFLLVSLGFHSAMLIKLVFISEKRKDFIEMCLHDILTIYLYSGSYLVNLWSIGATIALIHDLSDILLQGAKIFAETKHETITGLFFVSEMIVWFYTRLIVPSAWGDVTVVTVERGGSLEFQRDGAGRREGTVDERAMDFLSRPPVAKQGIKQVICHGHKAAVIFAGYSWDNSNLVTVSRPCASISTFSTKILPLSLRVNTVTPASFMVSPLQVARKAIKPAASSSP